MRPSVLAIIWLAVAVVTLPMSGAYGRPVNQISSGPTGAAAIRFLGKHLPAVAQIYRKTPDQLRSLLLRHASLRVDRHGRLYFLDPVPEMPQHSGQMPNAVPWLGGDLVPLDETFTLHSKPDADKTIYLDFRGRVLSETAWNAGAPLTVPPFDMDGDTGSFSDTELITIQYAWQQVAEDYAPFDVDVTTEPPPPERIRRSNVDDRVFGNEVLFVAHGGELDCECSDASFMNAFFDTEDTFKPAVVFYQGMTAGPTYLGNSAARTVGHSLGLSPDGTSVTDSYAGQGDSPVNGWQPIMGMEGWRPLSQFSKGEYADANNREDDFAVIVANGLPLRTDDAGDGFANALSLPVTASEGRDNGTFEGILSSEVDRDVFSISAGKGQLHASVRPAYSGPNADLALTLFDSEGRAVARSDPQENLGADLDQQITSAGRYFLEVKGTGEGDPLLAGYSAYGSVGAYRLSAEFAARVPPRAVLAATPASGTAPLAVSLDGAGSGSDGRITSFAWDFGDGTSSDGAGQSSARKTFSKPGDYPVTLKVTADSGLSSSVSRVISVKAAAVPRVLRVAVNTTGSGRKVKAKATVFVVDAAGKAAAKAVVTALWSGAVSANATGRTGRSGSLVFNSPPAAGGCFRLTVTSLQLGSSSYVPPPNSYGEACR